MNSRWLFVAFLVVVVGCGDPGSKDSSNLGEHNDHADSSSGWMNDSDHNSNEGTDTTPTIPVGAYGILDKVDVHVGLLDESAFEETTALPGGEEHVLVGAGFHGVYGSALVSVPPPLSLTFTYAWLDSELARVEGQKQIAISQLSFDVNGDNLNPLILVLFDQASVALGPLSVSMFESESPSQSSTLFVYEWTGSGEEDLCIAAVGEGIVDMTRAESVNREGGMLAFTGKDLLLLHPTNVFGVDFTTDFDRIGESVCPR